MRPRTLEEFVGQAHLVGERGPLRRSVARGHLASLLLWGPPGTGKTSLARLLAEAVGAEFRDASARSCPASPRSGRRSPRPRTGSRSSSGGRSCSSTRSTASTRRSRTRCCRTSRTARSRSSARRPRTPTSRSTPRSCRGCGSGAWSRSTDEDVALDRPAGARGRGARPRRDVRARGRRGDGRRAVRAPRRGRGRRRAPGAQRPRGRRRARRGRGRTATPTGRVSPTLARRRGRRPAAGPRLRPRRRRPLRHRVARSSRASAATTPTPRCTGSRRWSRPARTPGSSSGG